MIGAILLAAGNSSRFGSNKLLHLMASGHPVIVESARNLQQALGSAVVVVRHEDDEVCRALRPLRHVETIACAGSVGGIGCSIACGVAAAPDAEAWLIALGDMPYIRPETIADVARQAQAGTPIAAPVYRGQRGHPVAFGRALRDDLLALDGDTGARGLLVANATELELVHCHDPGVIKDIDTQRDSG